MRLKSNDDYSTLDDALITLNYHLTAKLPTSRLYQKADEKPILIDTTLFHHSPQEYHYVQYTSLQNKLMHQHQGIFRFLYSGDNRAILDEILFFTGGEEQVDKIKIYGQQRDSKHIDPTPPEFNFALIFERVFSGRALHALTAEDIYIDRRGVRRFIDYTLKRKTSSIAIELNGERYHHPLLTGEKQYRSQLFKQNSLVGDGYLVFRWSNRGMADDVKIEEQLRNYFGCSTQFCSAPHFRAERNISSFSLYEHQEDTLKRINEEREKGKSTFLVVLPTGTGKTEVFIEDMRQQYFVQAIQKVLVIVPTVSLKEQMVIRIKRHLPELIIGDELSDKSSDVTVQTSAYLLRHYSKHPADYYDYILVDEAHRAAANGLRKVLEYFNPKTLIGLTATDERLDNQRLEDIFGQYQVDLTLEQAITKGLVPPIRAFRLSSNIDLSKVRFNGKDFVKSDLNKTVLIPSRDQLIVDVVVKYFEKPLLKEKSPPQGIIFCVDIKHTKTMASILNKSGISAASVHGGDRKGIEQYEKGEIRFLCACELLNEGWDAPQTEVVVMARPTMSKVLYTQQLGRGTRKHHGKEALYVIDVVDSYGASMQPWSLHGLFNVTSYQPFENIVNPEYLHPQDELTVLDGLWEGERRIEPINIFNFEKEFGDLLNEEQLARELFVSTGTIKSWLKKGEISADKSLPFGRSTLHYFSQDKVMKIRELKSLKERSEASRLEDFIEFVEQRDYTFSYKIAFMLSLIKHCNERGEAELTQVTETYQSFYLALLEKFGKAEKDKNPLNDKTKLDDDKYVQRSLLQNPFEKFERKRFVYQCKDLAIISFDSILWEKLTEKDLAEVRKQYIEDGITYFKKLAITLSEEYFFNIFNREDSVIAEKVSSSNVTSIANIQASVVRETIELPLYPDIKIACGHFKTGHADNLETMDVDDTEYGKLDASRHFLAYASGNSMNGGKNPILDGDLLLLEWITATSAGSISGKTMVIEKQDEAGDSQYLLRVVKKQADGTYLLRAQNTSSEYSDIIATDNFRTLARLKSVVVLPS